MRSTSLAAPRKAGALAAVMVLALAACASAPPEHFYSLSSGLPLAETSVVNGAAGTAAANAAPYFIEVLAPSVPPQVARSQLVVTSGAGRVDLLEQERWSAPLGA